jgi:hypothetical protein
MQALLLLGLTFLKLEFVRVDSAEKLRTIFARSDFALKRNTTGYPLTCFKLLKICVINMSLVLGVNQRKWNEKSFLIAPSLCSAQ